MCVYCAVRTECLNVTEVCVSLQDVQGVGRPAYCHHAALKACDMHLAISVGRPAYCHHAALKACDMHLAISVRKACKTRRKLSSPTARPQAVVRPQQHLAT